LLAARAAGVRRYLQQLSGFFLKARGVLADESDGLAIDASAGVALSAQMYAELESRLERTEPLECVGLRYGFFYGPRTWFNPDGAAADQVRRQEIPIVGEGIKASGPGSTSRTRPRQPRRPSQLLPGFRTLSTTTPPPSVTGCRSSRASWGHHHRPGSPSNRRGTRPANLRSILAPSTMTHRTKRPRKPSVSLPGGWNGSPSEAHRDLRRLRIESHEPLAKCVSNCQSTKLGHDRGRLRIYLKEKNKET
jgi:hypothetical protein